MALYIHIYRTRDGKIDNEMALAETYDEAMENLDAYHGAMVKAGKTYIHTLMMVYRSDGMEPCIAHKQNLLREIDQWKTEQFNQQRAERRHELAVAAGVRSAQL